jgi:hypothetical protein
MQGTLYILLIVVALLCVYLVSLPTVKEHFLISDLKEKLAVVNPICRNIDIREASSSYTEDKSIIYLCLRNEQGQYYPVNTLIYVALHEIAHLLNRENFGHTAAFYKEFDKLLCQATEKGVYDPSIPHTSWYCGVDIRGITMPSCKMD